MKILLITHYYEPELGAPQRRWAGFVQRWQQAGHQVTVYCPSPHYPDRHSTGALRQPHNKPFTVERGNYGEKIQRLPYLLHGYSGVTRFLDQSFTAVSALFLALIREKKKTYDVVISTVPGTPSAFAGQAIANRQGCPHVLDLRDAWPDILVGRALQASSRNPLKKIEGSLKEKAANAFIKAVRHQQRQADMLVTTTYAFARILRGRGLTQVETITNGTDPQEFITLEPYNPDASSPLRLQYLGTIGRSQGLIVLLKSLRELQKHGLDQKIQLRIIGEGADLPHLKHYAEKHKLAVEFLPPIPRHELAQAYAWADANIVSLRNKKAFEWTVPSKIFELISTQRKIIALVSGEAAQIIKNTASGTVLQPGDVSALTQELEKLITEKSTCFMGDEPLNKIKAEYSYDVLAHRYLELLENLVDRGVSQK